MENKPVKNPQQHSLTMQLKQSSVNIS